MSTKDEKSPPGNWHLGGDTDTHDDPLLDCLMQLAKLHGRSATRTGLSSGLPLVNNRLSVELFPRAADRAGLSARTVHRPLESISPLQLPVVLLLKDRRACVLVNIGDGGQELSILLPETGMGEKTVTRQELEEVYTGYGIFVRPKFRLERQAIDEISPSSKRGWFWGTLFENCVYTGMFLLPLF